MGENVVFPVKFDTCDVMYNLSISLLPPIVLDNIFAVNVISRIQCPIYNGNNGIQRYTLQSWQTLNSNLRVCEVGKTSLQILILYMATFSTIFN